jgi:hypothetical protein
MASKYILSRDQFLINESETSNPLFNFLNEVGPELMEMLDQIKPVLPESVSDEFIENSQRYSVALDQANFSENSKLEHILYAMGTSGVTLFTESNFKLDSVIEHYYSINEDFFDTLRSIWNALTENGSPLGILHLVLDIIGFIPASYFGFPVDIVADGLNAIIYLFEGQYGSALISAIAAALPGIGDAAKALKLAKGFKKINNLAEVAFKTGKADAGIVKALAKEDPGTLAKFLNIFSGAKPVITFFANLVKGVGRGIEALLRSWPVSMLFGGLGKSLGKWLDEAVTPITKNLDSAIDDMATLTSKGSDDITAAIKSGDASLVADKGSDIVTKLGADVVNDAGVITKMSELTAAKAAGNMAEVKRIEGILQSRIEKGLPGAGRFVKNGRLIDVINSNLKISDDLLKKGGKELEQYLEKGWEDYISVWKEIKKVDGVPLTASDLNKIEELKTLWMEGRKAEALFAGMKKIDDIPADELVRLTGNAAEVSTKKGANFSARLVADISGDPAKLSKFFNGILSNPKTLAKLEEAGPGVVGMYRLFAKNPEVYVDIAKAGSGAIKRFDDLAKVGGKWSQALRKSRLVRNKLIIAKNIIGAPLRCPIAELGQGNIGGLEALSTFSLKKESTRFILSRNQFLLEADETPTEAITPSAELDKELQNAKRGNAIVGPLSYVDICQSHVNKAIDELALAATIPGKDSSLVKTGPKQDYAAGAKNEAAISNQEAVDATLAQMGIAPPISSAGMMIELPADATIQEVVSERVGTDWQYGGLWYMLAAVMTRDIEYDSVKSKIKSALKDYENNYKRTAGNTATTGAISFYPSPGEAQLIKSELEKLDADPSYSPSFFGGSITSRDLLEMF